MRALCRRVMPATLCFVVPLFVLLVSGRTSAQERDLWYVLTSEEKPFSAIHVEVTAAEDGTFRYGWETRALTNFLGQHQESKVTTECVVTEDLRPVSMRTEVSQLSGTWTSQGELVGNTLTVTAVQDGEETSSVFEVAEDLPVLFDSCLGEWLAQQPDEAADTTLQVVDDSTWMLVTATATALPSDPDEEGGRLWRVAREDGSLSMTIEVGADGFETERTYETYGIRMTRSTQAAAEAIEPNQQTGRTVLMFPVEPPISAPHRLTGLTVELRWKDNPFDDFELEDDRQHLLEHSEDADGSRAVVNIATPAPLESGGPFPAPAETQDESLLPFLAETDYIKPHHPDIRAAARGATQGASPTLEAVEALSSWVHEYIDPVLITETLSGPQVLVRKTGKCTEYSTLFASLARAVGIPTRMALGERMFGSQWGGHMWNEVYVGRWIPVDATVNEVGTSFALLKFIHSDTVAGTQPLRWALTKSLDIRVQDYAVTDAPLAGLFEPGIDGSTYTSVDFECRVTAPRPEWQLSDDSQTGNATIRFVIPDSDQTYVHFVAFSLPAGTPAKAFSDGRIEMFRPNYDSFEVVTNTPFIVGQASGQTTRFGGLAKGSDVEWRITEFAWTQGKFGYLLNLIATRAEHDEHLAAVEDLLASFEFLKPE